MHLRTTILDVRDDIRAGREPFSKIMAAASALPAGEDLLLIAPFEPVPLFHVLGKQGFTFSPQRMDDGDWHIRFRRESDVVITPGCGAEPADECAAAAPARIIEIDARGLEPPQPLVIILEAVATLPADAELLARTDRRPMHLYMQLDERGFSGKTEEGNDGSFITHIRRR